jgi:hypothetical protein
VHPPDEELVEGYHEVIGTLDVRHVAAVWDESK